MKYKVLQRLSYNGRIYNKDETINVLDMYVESLLKRALIEEIKGNKEAVKVEIEAGDVTSKEIAIEVEKALKEAVKETPQLTKEELLKLTKDKLIELATSKGITIDEELTKKEIIALILGD